MAGATTTYTYKGKKRPRKTRFFQLSVREPTWIDAHFLARKWGVSIADLMELMVLQNMQANGFKPTTKAYLDSLGTPTF